MGHWFKGNTRGPRRTAATRLGTRRKRNALRSSDSKNISPRNLHRRDLRIEQVESRLLLTSGPTLISIIPNDGSVWQPGQNITTHDDPTQLTFRFLLSAGETLDPTTLGGIQIARSGGDGVFGNGNDVTVTPGFIGIDPAQPNEVDMRFSSTLPDDLYQITIVGSGNNALKDTSGLNFSSQSATNPNYTQDFRLQLGPQVLSVVPQPVTRDASGNLLANNNEIDVYFNEPVQTLPGDATHLDPNQFELISTGNSSATSDDKVFVADPSVNSITPVTAGSQTIYHVPGSVLYNAGNNEARIVFQSGGGAISVNSLAAYAGVTGSDAFRLKIGNNNELPLTVSSATPYPGDA
ncbi:MAG: hypothetical protein ACREHD_11920, partial [Pirellulales bacterium]